MISNVNVHNNPAKFLSNYTFEIKFECLEQLTQGDFSTYLNIIETTVFLLNEIY